MPSVTFSYIEVDILQAATTHRNDEMDGINRNQTPWNGMFLGCVPAFTPRRSLPVECYTSPTRVFCGFPRRT
jgi:hypothetical protein